MSDIKQILIIRRDLKMRRGKEIAQAAHASVSASIQAMNKTKAIFNSWMNTGYKKVTVHVQTEQELVDLYNKAIQANLTASLITDSGKTEFNNVPTKTVLAIGPDESDKIDLITKDLPLY